MPGTTIGTKLSGPNEIVFTATQIAIEKRDGKYFLKWNFNGDPAITQRVQELLEGFVKELNKS
jgi:hypothetical protein